MQPPFYKILYLYLVYYLTICPLSVEITFCIVLYFIVSLGHIVDSALLLYLKYNLSYPALGIS